MGDLLKKSHLALALIALVACRTPPVQTGITGVRVFVHFDETLAIDQFNFEPSKGGQPLGDPKQAPTPPRTLSDGEDTYVRFLDNNTVFPDAESTNVVIKLRVEGLRAGAIVAARLEDVTLTRGEIVELHVTLGPPLACGDGKLGQFDACDDFNGQNGDGCSQNCEVEPEYLCSNTSEWDVSVCVLACGNGKLDFDLSRGFNEACDDGNGAAADGCTGCQVDTGYECDNTVSPSQCGLICGNGAIDTDKGEVCDDGDSDAGDGCTACARDHLYLCSGEPSVCIYVCGNGTLDDTTAGEECDDMNQDENDGCSSSCVRDPAWECPTPGTACNLRCGNGLVEADNNETCDVGSGMQSGTGCNNCLTDPLYDCNNMPSVCTLKCGNDMIDEGEVCDVGSGGGANVGGMQCTELGVVKGGGAGVGCQAGCLLFDTSAGHCDGGDISDVAHIVSALAEAKARTGAPDVVAIHPGTYPIGATAITINDCGGGATCSDAPGVTLRPLSGAVTFTGDSGGNASIFIVESANTIFRDLRFENPNDSRQAIRFEKTPNPVGNNYVYDCSFKRTTTVVNGFILADSSGNTMMSNRFVNEHTSAMSYAVFAESTASNTTIALNLISGAYPDGTANAAVVLNGGNNNVLDNNTFSVGAGSLSAAVRINGGADTAVRNNIIAAGSSTTGFYLAGAPTFTADSGKNDNVATVDCNDSLVQCGVFCDTVATNILCDLTTDPMLTGFCLGAASLADLGSELGYNFTGNASQPNNNGPPIGARDTGTTRSYGQEAVQCD